jgi:hypothetical protein
MLDPFMPGPLNLPPQNTSYTLEVAVPSAHILAAGGGGRVLHDEDAEKIAHFAVPAHISQQLQFDASTRASRRMRGQSADFFDIVAALDEQTDSLPPAREPSGPEETWPGVAVPIVFDTFTRTRRGGGMERFGGGGGVPPSLPKDTWTGPLSPHYNRTLDRFLSYFPNTSGHLCAKCNFASNCWQLEQGCRVAQNSTVQPLVKAGGLDAPNLIVGIGDEATLNMLPLTWNDRPNLTYSAAVFAHWAAGKGLTKNDVGCRNGSSWLTCFNDTLSLLHNDQLTLFTNPRLFYHFTIMAYDYGIAGYRQWTRSVTDVLPNALVGLNFSPGERSLCTCSQLTTDRSADRPSAKRL